MRTEKKSNLLLTGFCLALLTFGCKNPAPVEDDVIPPSVNKDCESEIVKKFLSLPDTVFNGDEFFNRTEIEQMFCSINNSENNDGWNYYRISENGPLLTLCYDREVIACYDFILMENGALLFVNNDGKETLRHFEQIDSNTWVNGKAIPLPHPSEFFTQLTDEELKAVNQWGIINMYVMSGGSGIELMVGDSGIDRDSLDIINGVYRVPPQEFIFELHWDADSFWVEKYPFELSPVTFQ